VSAPRLFAPAILLASLAAPGVASAYCPCYTASSASNDQSCAIEAAPGTNPTVAEWNGIFDVVSQGPAFWGDKGPTVGDIGQGCGKPEPLHNVPARFPCELLKAIAKVESGWRQFCVPDLPSDQVGGASRTIISFDCGYGVGQVTSGMHVGESPTFDRDRVAADPTYNLATGTRILAAKWKATNCVGDNQPKTVEHWYIATWAYNGLAYVNNPNNPNYDPNRGVWSPQVGGGAPYQEKVFGYMEYTNGQWDAVALAYPNRGDIGQATSPPELPEPSCASPTDCGNQRATHTTQCDGPTDPTTSSSSSTAASSSASSSAGAGGSGAGVGGSGGAGQSSTSSSGSTGSWGDEGGGGSGADGNGAIEGFVSCQCRTAPPRGGSSGPLGLGALAALFGLGLLRRRPR
jgi:MYXO-CTERM domain-containing protein